MSGRSTTSIGSEGGDRLPPLDRRMWTGLVVLTLSTFIVVLDSSVVFIALPSILDDLGGSLDLATWIIAGFILAFAVFLVPFGKLGDLYGRRIMCQLGIGVFTVASVGCALAPSIELLIVGRVIQGIGAAMVEPTVLALIKSTFPRKRLGLAFGVQGVAAGVAASLGPTMGGLLTTAASWEYIFLINVPIGAIAVVGIALTVGESRGEPTSRRIDVPGVLLSSTGLFALVFAIIEGQELGWRSAPIAGSFAAAAVLIAAFVLVESRTQSPLVDLGLFRDRLYTVGNVLRGVVEFVTLGVFFPLALYLQVQLGYTALETGLILLPLVVGSFFTSPLAGSLSDRIDARWIVIPGLLVAAGGIVWLANLSPDRSWLFFLGPLALLGLGLGALYGTTTSTALRNVPDEQSGVASSISYAAFLIGSELGLAVVAALLQTQLVANFNDAGTGLPPGAAEEIGSSLSGSPAATSGAPSAGLPPELALAFEGAFADAVNVALLACAAAAALGALLAVLLSQPGTSHADR